ncbi:MAG: RNA polymerase sigma factor [Verrucomicrobiales bacterium]
MSHTDRHTRFLEKLRPLQAELEGYARKMLWEPQETADALQNAALRAYRAFDRYREDASFRGWMYRILTNEIHTLNRKHSRRARFEFQLAPEELAALAGETDSVSPSAWEQGIDDRLRTALQALPEQERTVLVLRGLSELSYHEIAIVMDVPLGSVMGYLSRSRRKMRAALGNTELNRRREAP